MRHLKFIATGIIFGIILTKSEFLSWYRWQELFLFKGFRLVGVMATAVAVGAVGIFLIKKFKIKDIHNQPIIIPDKKRSFYRYAIGGLIFGLGWSMAGCPGATYTLLGNGYLSMIVGLFAATMGTFVYGLLRDRLPH